MIAINSNAPEAHPEETLARIGQDVLKQGYVFPYLKDYDQEVARRYKAACTLDLYLFDAARRLAYHGQFDGFRPGNGVEPTGADLQAALDALATFGHRADKLLQLSRAESSDAFARQSVDLVQIAATVAEEFWSSEAARRRLDLEIAETGVVAARGVVVAAGGFAANRPMMRAHAPAARGGLPLATPGDDGSGVQRDRERRRPRAREVLGARARGPAERRVCELVECEEDSGAEALDLERSPELASERVEHAAG